MINVINMIDYMRFHSNLCGNNFSFKFYDKKTISNILIMGINLVQIIIIIIIV